MMTLPAIPRSRSHRQARLLAAAALGLALGACTQQLDPTGPGVEGPGLRRASSGDKLVTGGTETSTTTTAVAPTLLRFATWAPPLTTYDTTFTLVQGKASADTIYFVKRPIDLVRVPYLILTTPKDGQFVDSLGKALPNGSTVKLTVHADQTNIELQFGPHGSTFTKNPAKLKIFWLFTDLGEHLGSDLKMWYQPVAGTTWSQLATTVDLQFFWLVSDIDHFSNYHVAY